MKCHLSKITQDQVWRPKKHP